MGCSLASPLLDLGKSVRRYVVFVFFPFVLGSGNVEAFIMLEW
jgi:hypothetical protein